MGLVTVGALLGLSWATAVSGPKDRLGPKRRARSAPTSDKSHAQSRPSMRGCVQTPSSGSVCAYQRREPCPIASVDAWMRADSFQPKTSEPGTEVASLEPVLQSLAKARYAKHSGHRCSLLLASRAVAIHGGYSYDLNKNHIDFVTFRNNLNKATSARPSFGSEAPARNPGSGCFFASFSFASFVASFASSSFLLLADHRDPLQSTGHLGHRRGAMRDAPYMRACVHSRTALAVASAYVCVHIELKERRGRLTYLHIRDAARAAERERETEQQARRSTVTPSDLPTPWHCYW